MAVHSIALNVNLWFDSMYIPAFQILKDDAVKMLYSICQQIWKTQQWPQYWKRPVFIPIPKKGKPKEGSNYHTMALDSHTSKVILKILQARLQQDVNYELPDVQAGFRKGRRTRDQIANICWIIEKAREFQKNINFCFPQQTVENCSRDGNTRPPNLPPEKSVCKLRSNIWNRTWNNRLVPHWESSMSRLCIVTQLI